MMQVIKMSRVQVIKTLLEKVDNYLQERKVLAHPQRPRVRKSGWDEDWDLRKFVRHRSPNFRPIPTICPWISEDDISEVPQIVTAIFIANTNQKKHKNYTKVVCSLFGFSSVYIKGGLDSFSFCDPGTCTTRCRQELTYRHLLIVCFNADQIQ